MHRGVVAALLAALATATALTAPAHAAGPDDAPIVVDGSDGLVDVVVRERGQAGSVSEGAPVRAVGAGSAGGGSSDAPTCTYRRNAYGEVIPRVEGGVRGDYFEVYCSDGTTDFVFVPIAGDAPPQATVEPVVTPAQLALEVRDELPLARPTIQRSPDETIRFQGDPMTWVNLWTWFWTDRAAFAPMTQTVSAGAVSATVTATPVGLLFDPGDGSTPVRCAGPGRAWVERDGNAAPPAGCGYRYRSVTDGTITSTVSILWDVTWAGSGGLSGALPQMRTQASAPLRVMQIQVVNG